MPGGIEPVSLGSIQYINSLPVDIGILTGQVPFDGRVVRGVPASLNEQLLDGRIQISPASAIWCAIHSARFLILPDLSISSESGVQSVLLFSRRPAQELGAGTIWVTGEGRTTPALLEILCRKFYGFTPKQTVLPTFFTAPPEGDDAVLLIGDDALLHRERLVSSGFIATDLAEEWKRLTGTGFVFALWAVRRDFFGTATDRARRAIHSLMESKRWGQAHRGEVVAEAQRRTMLPEANLERYFACLSYGLDKPLMEGLNLYLTYARELGILPAVPPLSFVDGALDSPADNRYNKAFIPEAQ